MYTFLNTMDLCKILNLYKYNDNECLELISEFRTTGITHFLNYGFRRIYDGFKVIGVGFTGISMLALYNNNIVLVKVLRKDSRRESMKYECNIIEKASKIGVAPRLYSCNDKYMVMEFIDGYSLHEYIENFEAISSLYDLKIILKSIIYKTFLLDINRIDHGELSRPYKHVLISPKGVFIIDFDSASVSRAPRNLTSILSGLFFRRNKLASKISSVLGVDNNNNLLRRISSIIREYKKRIDFSVVLEIMRALKII